MSPWPDTTDALSQRIRHLKTLQARAREDREAVPAAVLDLDNLLVERAAIRRDLAARGF